jgi:acetyltransferase-like isoleucine patch superfamily enzyme
MIHNSAIVNTKNIGKDVIIKEYVVIRDNVMIGNNVVIHPHVVIESGVEIGDDVEIFPGAYIGKEPKGAGVTSRIPVFNKKITIGRGVSVGPKVIIFYDVQIGNQVLIGDGVSIREQSSIGNKTIIGRYCTINYNTKIGNDTKIMDHVWLAGNMSIGNNVFMGGGIMTANDNEIGPNAAYSEDKIKGPTIEDDVAVGIGAILLPQITIGKGAFVAAGAVVTKDVAPHSRVAGIPARFITR